MKNIKEAVAKCRKVALYASLEIKDYYTVWEVLYVDHDEHYSSLPIGQQRERQLKGYVRVSEPFTVDFSPVSDDVIVQNAVASLDEEERKAVEDLNAKVAGIRERKNQLLALTHQTEAA